jgi:dTMP kinase
VLLDLDPAEGARRQAAEGKAADRLEREEAAFHRRVADAYRAHAARVAGIVRVEALGTPDQVHGRVVGALAERFPETFAGTRFTNAEHAPPQGGARSRVPGASEVE